MFHFDVRGFLVLVFAWFGGAAAASGAGGAAGQAARQPEAPVAEARTVRVGGDYVVAAVDRDEHDRFQIQFRSVNPTGAYDLLKLESDHVHVGIKVGMKVRMSAEVVAGKDDGRTAEVSQVVVFFDGPNGRVPVWLLSTKVALRDLKAVKYLEMHVPATDFVVM